MIVFCHSLAEASRYVYEDHSVFRVEPDETSAALCLTASTPIRPLTRVPWPTTRLVRSQKPSERVHRRRVEIERSSLAEPVAEYLDVYPHARVVGCPTRGQLLVVAVGVLANTSLPDV